jgi:hypothetical protein
MNRKHAARPMATLFSAALVVVLLTLARAGDTTISNFDVAAQANKTIRLKDNTDTTFSYAVWLTGDGTHFQPAGDAVARSIFAATGDATNAFKSATAANLAALSGTNAQLVAKPGMWASTATGTAGTQATVAQAAGGTGVKLVLDSVTVSLGAGAAAQTPITASVIQDAGGSPVTLWAATLAAPANGSGVVSASNLNIISTVANKSLTVQFSGTGTANTIQSVSMSGYSAQ